MLLGFKRRFEPFILDGSKTHTIRASGGRTWRPGMRCDNGTLLPSALRLLRRFAPEIHAAARPLAGRNRCKT